MTHGYEHRAPGVDALKRPHLTSPGRRRTTWAHGDHFERLIFRKRDGPRILGALALPLTCRPVPPLAKR